MYVRYFYLCFVNGATILHTMGNQPSSILKPAPQLVERITDRELVRLPHESDDQRIIRLNKRIEIYV